MKGRTQKPCPACKEKPDWRGRPADGVCGDCERKLKEYAVLQTQTGQRKREGMEPVRLGDVYYRFPGFYMGLARGNHASGGPREKLQEVIANLIMECAEKEPKDGAEFSVPMNGRSYLTHKGFSIYGRGRKDGGAWESCSEPYIMRPKVAELFRELYDAISDALTETHHKSLAAGQNVLLQLASGEMSIAEFNERTLEP